MTEDQILRREERRVMMLEKPIANVLLVVAVPMIVAMLINSFYNMTERILSANWAPRQPERSVSTTP